MRDDLKIGRAGFDAAADVHALICEAAQWLTQRGETLWGDEETSLDELHAVVRAGELVIARRDDQLCACMYLHTEDRLFWPDMRVGEALYLHRLAVARRFAGQGISLRMLEWALHEANRQGRDYVRLDCEPRPKLLALYRAAGFTPVDAGPIQVGRHFVVRHQRPVAR